MQKFYCYVDESGQETQGKVFIVVVVIVAEEPGKLFAFCERLERASGKGKFKW